MPVTVQTPISSGRALVGADWDTLLPYSGSAQGQFTLSSGILNGNIGKYIKIIPTDPAGTVSLVAGAVGPSSSTVLTSASRQWVDPSSTTWTQTTLDSFAVTVPSGTRRALFVEGLVMCNTQQNLSQILFNYAGTDYQSLIGWNTGYSGSARTLFLHAIPLGTSGSGTTPTVTLKIQNIGALNCQPQGAEYRYWIVDYTDQVNPVADKQSQLATDVAAAVTAALSVTAPGSGGFAIGFSAFGGGVVTGQKVTSGASTVTDATGGITTAGSKATGYLAGLTRATAAGAVGETFDFTGGPSGNKVGAVLVATRPDLTAAGGGGVTVVTTASNLASSKPGGAIAVTALTASMVQVEVE